MDTVDLAQYAVRGSEADWEAATKRSKAGSQGGSGTVSIKSKVPTQWRERIACRALAIDQKE